MKRIASIPRPNWPKRVEDLGFSFHTDLDGSNYWFEKAAYQFTSKQIDEIDDAAASLQIMCLQAVDYVISNKMLSRLAIPENFHAIIENSWNRRDPTIFGRFDFSYDGINPPKMLEYNADTPTSLLEASVIQWDWLEDTRLDADQFNLVHESLIEAWNKINPGKPVYFSSVSDTLEDVVTVEYMMDVAIQGGVDARWIAIGDIGSNGEEFYDLDNNRIEYMFKLYPWEWLIEEEFGEILVKETINFMEPPWKMILSNKAILPILWEMFPGHPNLLETYFEATNFDKPNTSYVIKPIFSREGAGITIITDNKVVFSNDDGVYGKEGFIYQEYCPLPQFDNKYPVLGVWVINNKPVGMGIREDSTLVTANTSQFVPHFFNKE